MNNKNIFTKYEIYVILGTCFGEKCQYWGILDVNMILFINLVVLYCRKHCVL